MYLPNEDLRQRVAVLGKIPDGVAGTGVTLDLMRDAVKRGKKNLRIRETALSLLDGLLQKDYLGEAKRLHRFVRDEIRYVRDIDGTETLHDAEQVLDYGQGDCDDKSILLASLLGSIGHKARLVAIGYHPRAFCHVYVETLVGKKWVPLETTEPVEAGWRPPIKPVLRMERDT